MKNQKWIAGPLVLACSLGLVGFAHAQPGGNNGGGNRGGGNRPNPQNMTPEQRAQMEARMQQFQQQREQQRTDWVRGALTGAGYGDAALQDAVIDIMKTDVTGLASLQEMERQLAGKLVDAAVTPEALATDLKAFRDAVQKYEDDKKAKLEKFDVTYKYSTQPKLETTLVVLGALGHQTTLLGGLGQVFPDSPYGRGGFGGGNAGGGQGVVAVRVVAVVTTPISNCWL